MSMPCAGGHRRAAQSATDQTKDQKLSDARGAEQDTCGLSNDGHVILTTLSPHALIS